MSEKDGNLKRMKDTEYNLKKQKKINDMNKNEKMRVRQQEKLRTKRYRDIFNIPGISSMHQITCSIEAKKHIL